MLALLDTNFMLKAQKLVKAYYWWNFTPCHLILCNICFRTLRVKKLISHLRNNKISWKQFHTRKVRHREDYEIDYEALPEASVILPCFTRFCDSWGQCGYHWRSWGQTVQWGIQGSRLTPAICHRESKTVPCC